MNIKVKYIKSHYRPVWLYVRSPSSLITVWGWQRVGNLSDRLKERRLKRAVKNVEKAWGKR